MIVDAWVHEIGPDFFLTEVSSQYSQLDYLSYDIVNLSNDNAHRIANVFHALTRLLTSYLISGHATNSTIGKGFVTIPDVEELFGAARKNSGALIIAYLPDVSVSELDAWNKYSKEKQGWIQKSYGTTVNVTDSILPSIWKNQAAEQGSSCDVTGSYRKLLSDEARRNRVAVVQSDTGPFSPVWNMSPPPRANDVGIINFDLRGKSIWQEAAHQISTMKKAAFLNTCNFATWFDNDAPTDTPQTTIVFPVFDSHDHETADVVGHLIAVVPWSVLFERVILHEASPSIVVVENTCNKVLSFKTKGLEVEFLAEEARQDKAFEDMAITDSFAQANAHDMYYDTRDDSGEHGQEGTCLYSISVYPTKAMKDEHVSMQSVAFTAVVVAVFLVTSFLFFLFERYVRRKLDTVTKLARKQNVIVSSLFPKNVQDKLLSEGMGTSGIKTFLTAQQESGHTNRELMVTSKPIAGTCPGLWEN